MGLLSGQLTQEDSISHVDRDSSLKIRQRERGPPITTVGRSQYREQSLVLIDCQQLSITERPALWREIPTNYFDLSQEWFRHVYTSPSKAT